MTPTLLPIIFVLRSFFAEYAEMVVETLRCEDWAIFYLVLVTAAFFAVWMHCKTQSWQYKNQRMLKILKSISKVFAIIHGLLLIVAVIVRLAS